MPLGDFEREVLRLLAANRNPHSFVGGAAVLHQAPESLRSSRDVDVFHDTAESLAAAATLGRKQRRCLRDFPPPKWAAFTSTAPANRFVATQPRRSFRSSSATSAASKARGRASSKAKATPERNSPHVQGSVLTV
jgi:hypothetical protein